MKRFSVACLFLCLGFAGYDVSITYGSGVFQTPAGASVNCADKPLLNAQKKVVSCVLKNNSTYFIPGGAADASRAVGCARGATVRFDVNGRVSSCVLTFDSNYRANGGVMVQCKGQRVVNFDPSGNVTSCALANNAYYITTAGKRVFCKAGQAISFDSTGRVTGCGR